MKFPSVLLFLVVGAQGAIDIVRNQAGGFMESCKDIMVGPHVADGADDLPWHLAATCGNPPAPMSVKIDDCIGNDNGRLVWQDGGRFSEACTSCVLNSPGPSDAPPGLYLQCRCKNKGGGAPEVGRFSFNLNSKVTFKPPPPGDAGSGSLSCEGLDH